MANDYYTFAPHSWQVSVATRQRRLMYRRFTESFALGEESSILDVGVTADRTYASSNYLEAWYPFPNRITAIGLDDAAFLAKQYPGMTFVRGNGLLLPFRDQSFDIVHCSAVIEHVGNFENQKHLIEECGRVARHGIFVTTPYRWFPVEVHTSIPFLHWLPKRWHRAILARLGYAFYSSEHNLNLLDKSDMQRIGEALPGWSTELHFSRMGTLPSNLLFVASRQPQVSRL
jgi:ubiquinone/menaquinone biosynthesis C-methylase UbiE